MNANERQVGGDHYGGREFQHWDLVWALGLDYFLGQATKYLGRHALKNGPQDVEKAIHFMQKRQELSGGAPGGVAPAAPVLKREQRGEVLAKFFAANEHLGELERKAITALCYPVNVSGQDLNFAVGCAEQLADNYGLGGLPPPPPAVLLGAQQGGDQAPTEHGSAQGPKDPPTE